MATEQEELRLSVTLDDQASAQLGRLQAALNSIGQTANTTTQGFTQLGQALRQAGGHGRNLHGSLNSMAARGGFIGGFFFEMGRQAENMAKEFAKAVLDVKAYADSMVNLQVAASRAATSAAQFQRNVSLMRQSGLTAAEAAQNIQGFADALADLQQERSRVRENLLGGLQGAELRDMVQFIRRIQSVDRQTATAEAKKFQEDIRAYWTGQGLPERGAMAAREFAAVLGMPDLGRMRVSLETITPALQHMYDMRMDNAERFQTATEKTADGWERSVRSVQATAFRVLPIRESAEGLAEFTEDIAHWLEGWEGSISDAAEELEQIEGSESGFWFELFSALGITGKKTRGGEIRGEGGEPSGGDVPLPRPRPPTQTWRIPTPGGAQQFMGGGVAGGPGSILDVGALGLPSIGDLLAPQAGGGITVPGGDFAGTGWRGLPLSKRVIDIRAQGPDELAGWEENSEEMEALADELNRLNEFLAPEMIELMKRVAGASTYHNAPMGGAEGESNPIQLPAGASHPGGGAASEAAQSAREQRASRMASVMSEAMTYIGKNESAHAAMLKDYMQTGGRNLTGDQNAWCARFVNAVQTRAGYAGNESWGAKSYLDWGRGVGADEEIREGDVFVKSRKGGGHVGVATGNYRVNEAGVKEYEMLSGNIGGSKKGGGEVNLTYETIGGRGAGATAGAGHGGVVAVRRGVDAPVTATPLPTPRPSDAPGAEVAQQFAAIGTQLASADGMTPSPILVRNPGGEFPGDDRIFPVPTDAQITGAIISTIPGAGDVGRGMGWIKSLTPKVGSGTPFLDQRSEGLDQAPDATAIDRAAVGADISQSGRLRVDVDAPAGTSVSAEGSGVFTNTETNRSIPMEQTAE